MRVITYNRRNSGLRSEAHDVFIFISDRDNLFILSGHQLLVSKLRSSEWRIIVFADYRDAIWTITMLLLCRILVTGTVSSV